MRAGSEFGAEFEGFEEQRLAARFLSLCDPVRGFRHHGLEPGEDGGCAALAGLPGAAARRPQTAPAIAALLHAPSLLVVIRFDIEIKCTTGAVDPLRMTARLFSPGLGRSSLVLESLMLESVGLERRRGPGCVACA